jgi:aminopeptidase N
LNYQKPRIENVQALLGPRNVNFNAFSDADMYYKGSWMLHSLRNTVSNDSLWFAYIKGLYLHFAGKITNTKEIVSYTNNYLKKDYTSFFQQYLLYPDLPVFEYKVEKKGEGIQLNYRWKANVESFNMPMKIGNGNQMWRILPTTKWNYLLMKDISMENFTIDSSSFLFESRQVEYVE